MVNKLRRRNTKFTYFDQAQAESDALLIFLLGPFPIILCNCMGISIILLASAIRECILLFYW